METSEEVDPIISFDSHVFLGGLEALDEVEIFEDNNFVLRMTQTYAHRFQCQFDLALYPFDTQVTMDKNISCSLLSFANA